MAIIRGTRLFENIPTALSTATLYTGSSGILLSLVATWIPFSFVDDFAIESNIWITAMDIANKSLLGHDGVTFDVGVVPPHSGFSWDHPNRRSIEDGSEVFRFMRLGTGNPGLGVFAAELKIDYLMDPTNAAPMNLEPQSMNVEFMILAFEA